MQQAKPLLQVMQATRNPTGITDLTDMLRTENFTDLTHLTKAYNTSPNSVRNISLSTALQVD